MDIKVSKKTYTTFTIEKELKNTPIEIDEDSRKRGLYYNYQNDEVALGEARSFLDNAAKLLREKTKTPDAKVSLVIDRRENKLIAIASVVVVS